MSQTAQTKAIRLTPRDIQIILSVYRYDGLFSYQIRNRFWGENGHPKTFNGRLAELIDAGYLRARPMDSTTGQGSGQRLITIGHAAHPLLRDRAGLTDLEIKRLRHSIVPADWRHDADVRDFGLSLELAAEAHPKVEEMDWENEAIFKRQPLKVLVTDPNQPERQLAVELVPDWGFRLKVTFQKRPKQHYLEVDRDTERRAKLIGRIRAYLQLVGSEQIAVLWTVPSRSRAEKLASWIQAEADSLQTRASIFAITTQDQVDQRRILTHPIWQVVGLPEARSLLPATAHHRSAAPSVQLQPLFGKEEIGA